MYLLLNMCITGLHKTHNLFQNLTLTLSLAEGKMMESAAITLRVQLKLVSPPDPEEWRHKAHKVPHMSKPKHKGTQMCFLY